MAMHFLLDTSALLAHYRRETGWEAVQELFENVEAEITIDSPTLAEFARRLHSLGAGDDEIQQVLNNYTLLFSKVVAIDGSVAMVAYAIDRQTPARLPLIDALIAAAAQTIEADLVHRDPHIAVIPVALVPQLVLT